MSCIFTNKDKKFCMWLFMKPVYHHGNMLGPSNNNLKSQWVKGYRYWNQEESKKRERGNEIKHSNIHND